MSFQACFSAFMILFPASFVTLYPTQQGADDRAATRQLRATWLATVGALGLWGVALPLQSELTSMIWLLFFPLWSGFAQKVFVTKNPGYAHPPGAVRAASLVSRQRQLPIPRVAWLVPLAIMAVSALVLELHHASWQSWLIWSGGLVWVGAAPRAIQLTLAEPEPMDTEGSQQLATAYEELRSFKAWGFFTMGLLAVAVLSVTSVLLALDWQRAALWAGAGGGSVVGILGGVTGTWADIRRARVANLRYQLSQGQV